MKDHPSCQKKGSGVLNISEMCKHCGRQVCFYIPRLCVFGLKGAAKVLPDKAERVSKGRAILANIAVKVKLVEVSWDGRGELLY